MSDVAPHIKTKMPTFLAVDFFCGAGGTTRGLIDSGGYVIAGIDKDGRCAQTYSDNNLNRSVDYAPARFLNYDVFARTPDYEEGQRDELVTELDSLLSYYRGKALGVPLLFAICAPCQPFTTLSRKELSDKRKKGREKDRGLLAEAAEYVSRYKPEMILSENVAGIKDPRYGNIWEDFRGRLNELGYVTGSKVVCTSRFGVPQYRKRSILIAVRRELVREERFADMMESELLVPDADPNAMVVTVADAIGHLPTVSAGETHPEIPNHRARALSELNLKRIASAMPGESNAYLERTEFGDLSLDCHRKVNARLNDRCFSDVYTRMHPNRPSPTITTKCHSISNGRFGHYDVKQIRGISLREAAILQSFPDDYVFYPTEQIEPVARMIGNAVPPRLAQYFATYLANSLEAGPSR
ncbi:DNA cytosine methyltransferase [Glycocaulis sp.]|uniref:DNA cytosine methyltransferase n=1 Tax=Glycocaulis sp. TaxID=1969725 RepID=UPI003D1C9850